MKNVEKFKEIFKEFATEVWAFPEKDFLTWLNAEYEEPTTKNDLGVDCISRQALLNTTVKKNSIWNKITDSEGNNLETIISNLPTVTPQEQQTFKWCTDCREYDQEKHCCHRWSKVIRDTVEEMKQEQEQETVSKEVYDHEYFLRKEFEIKIARLEHDKNVVIDKIRAEIEELKPNNPNFKGYFEQNVALNKVLEILDKYKAESERQRNEDNCY